MEESPSRTTDLAKSYGSNWTKANVSTLFEWIAIAAYNIKCLELGIIYYRRIIQKQTIYGLFISTLTGTLSVYQISGAPGTQLTTILNGLFTFFSFTIAIFTGFVKVYQIQEQLEHFIKLKQDWTVFSTSIASELQLPVELRRDALFIIMKNKNTYLDLLKVDVEFPSHVPPKVKREMPFPENLSVQVSTLPEIIMDIGSQELKDLESASVRNKDRFSTHPLSLSRKPLPSIPEGTTIIAQPTPHSAVAPTISVPANTIVSSNLTSPDLTSITLDVNP
jgi:hypothetical protein